MPETILVIEYEPRYTDRVRQALSGQPFAATFARDGEEALQAISSQQPRLIVLSSVVPKTTTADLIRAIRGQSTLQKVPILLTVSGYAGTAPEADAQRVGANDILAKPYSDAAFLGKVQQLLGIAATAPAMQPAADHIVRASAPAEPGNLTSSDIFGDVLEEERTVVTPARKIGKTSGDVDKMIADTLAGVMPPKKPATPGLPKTSPGTEPRPKTDSGRTPIDKILNDTLSGLEKQARLKSAPPQVQQPPAPVPPATPAAPPVAPPQTKPVAAQPPAQPPAAAPRPAEPLSVTPPPAAAKPAQPSPAPSNNGFDRMPVSQPVLVAPPPPVEDEEPTDGVKFGQYVLLEKIATGGMAEVWKARMRGVEGFQKIVAIKKILPHLSDNQDFIEMFVDEAKLAAQLTHNNIIHIYDLGKIQTSYYIAMEYVDGWDLKTILKKAEEHGQPMTPDVALFVASKIAAALDYAHRRRDFDGKELGLVHRDVSPQNVLISQEGDIKLCDFGIAKAASKASHTQAGALKGKLQYMSPEQAWGHNIDRRADIFALAAVLFEMLTGRKLFTGENEMSILEQVREARITKPSEFNDEVTPEIDAVVLKALAREPDDRYQTAAEMARDLDQILYTFRPTPTSADLAIFMHRLSQPVPVAPAGPDLDDTVAVPVEPPKPAPVVEAKPVAAAATPAVPMPAWDAEPSRQAPFAAAAEEKKKSKVVPIAIAAIVVIAAGVGGFFFMQKGKPAPAPATASAPAAATASTVPAAAPTDTAVTAAASDTTATTATTASIDPAKVEEEVRKRLDAEKQKLDRLATPAPQPVQQQAAARPAPVTATQAPAPRPATQTTAPPPAPTETRAPAQVASTNAPVPETRSAPAPVEAPAPAKAREGDLVSTSEGLTPPRLVRMAPVMYPPIARAQKIEGNVTVGVLVSEKGQVLDVRVLSGVNRPGGLNEAAQQTIRRSTFAPGMKDGVHVKSWVSVRVEFKL